MGGTHHHPKGANPNLVPGEARLETLGYFTPSWYPIASLEKQKSLRIVQDDFEGAATVTIAANPKWGLPTTADRDFYRGFQQILWSQWRRSGEVPEFVPFSTRKILNLAGRNRGDDWKRVKSWRRRLHATLITFDGDAQTVDRLRDTDDASWTVFSSTSGAGAAASTGEVLGTHIVQLSAWYRKHLIDGYVRPVDVEGELRLRSPIAKELSSLLDTMFFARRQKVGSGPIRVSKRYDDVARDFLLRHHQSRSLVERQFARAHAELCAIGKVRRASIRPSKRNGGWILDWECGPRMEQIWEAWRKDVQLPRNKTRSQPVRDQLQETLADDSNDRASNLVGLFQERLNAIEDYRPNPKEAAQAAELLARHGFDRAAKIVDLAVAMMKRTRFQAQWFGAVLAYEERAVARLKDRKRAEERALAGRVLEARQVDHDRRLARAQEAAFAVLPQREQQRRLKQARRALSEKPWIATQSQKMGIDLDEIVRREALSKFVQEGQQHRGGHA